MLNIVAGEKHCVPMQASHLLKRYVLAPPIGRPFGDVNDQTLEAGRNTFKNRLISVLGITLNRRKWAGRKTRVHLMFGGEVLRLLFYERT